MHGPFEMEFFERRTRDAVQLAGFVPFEQFSEYMAAMDVCVNLRYPTAGETSGAVLRAAACPFSSAGTSQK